MKRSKAYRAAAEKIDRGQALHARSRPSGSAKDTVDDEVSTRPSRSPCGLGVDPRKADQMVRGTVNLPHGTGKTARVIVFATGEQGRRRPSAAGADIVGADEPDRRGPGRLARLRRRRRHARPDGQGRPPRPRARPAWPDAEPEDRHRHAGRRQGRVRHQGRQDRVPRRQARRTCTSSSARRRSASEQLVENYAAALDEVLRLKPSAVEGPLPEEGRGSPPTMGLSIPG